MENHPVVERGIDPLSDGFLELAKIDHHAEAVEFVRLKRDHRFAVVSMEIFAFSIVLKQTMTIAKVDFPRHSVHQLTSLA
jgi:hypothetical protein